MFEKHEGVGPSSGPSRAYWHETEVGGKR